MWTVSISLSLTFLVRYLTPFPPFTLCVRLILHELHSTCQKKQRKTYLLVHLLSNSHIMCSHIHLTGLLICAAHPHDHTFQQTFNTSLWTLVSTALQCSVIYICWGVSFVFFHANPSVVLLGFFLLLVSSKNTKGVLIVFNQAAQSLCVAFILHRFQNGPQVSYFPMKIVGSIAGTDPTHKWINHTNSLDQKNRLSPQRTNQHSDSDKVKHNEERSPMKVNCMSQTESGRASPASLSSPACAAVYSL